jgi:hypothetical protein
MVCLSSKSVTGRLPELVGEYVSERSLTCCLYLVSSLGSEVESAESSDFIAESGEQAGNRKIKFSSNISKACHFWWAFFLQHTKQLCKNNIMFRFFLTIVRNNFAIKKFILISRPNQ